MEVERAGEVRQVLKRSDVGKTQNRRFRGRRRGRGRRRVERAFGLRESLRDKARRITKAAKRLTEVSKFRINKLRITDTKGTQE